MFSAAEQYRRPCTCHSRCALASMKFQIFQQVRDSVVETRMCANSVVCHPTRKDLTPHSRNKLPERRTLQQHENPEVLSSIGACTTQKTKGVCSAARVHSQATAVCPPSPAQDAHRIFPSMQSWRKGVKIEYSSMCRQKRKEMWWCGDGWRE